MAHCLLFDQMHSTIMGGGRGRRFNSLLLAPAGFCNWMQVFKIEYCPLSAVLVWVRFTDVAVGACVGSNLCGLFKCVVRQR